MIIYSYSYELIKNKKNLTYCKLQLIIFSIFQAEAMKLEEAYWGNKEQDFSLEL